MKSKTVKWGEHGDISIPIKSSQQVYTCEIDSLRRPSAIAEAKDGQKCIVILLEGEKIENGDNITSKPTDS